MKNYEFVRKIIFEVELIIFKELGKGSLFFYDFEWFFIKNDC